MNELKQEQAEREKVEEVSLFVLLPSTKYPKTLPFSLSLCLSLCLALSLPHYFCRSFARLMVKNIITCDSFKVINSICNLTEQITVLKAKQRSHLGVLEVRAKVWLILSMNQTIVNVN